MNRRIGVWLALTVAGIVAIGRPGHAQEGHVDRYSPQSGEGLYRDICQGCHMPTAQGAIGAGAYPALANDARLKAAVYPMMVVINGQRAMPPFGPDLSDGQIANVINYVRTHFGNHYGDMLTAAAVQAARR